ncbi:MAG: hypothetical protein JXR07_16850 [Reichenbachiella sp.]
MKELKYIGFWLVIGFLGIFACTDPVEENRQAIERAYQDSLAQAELDNIAIDQFIIDNEINSDDVMLTDNGVRYVILDIGDEVRFPEINDILSVDLLGQFEDGTPFETTSKAVASSIDSATYVENGVDVALLMEENNYTLNEALTHLSDTEDALANPFLRTTQSYFPFGYNHTTEGSGLGTTLDIGLRIGLRELIPSLSVNGVGYIFVPSEVAKGTSGGYTTIYQELIEPNTPLFYKAQLTAIRP